MAWVERAWRSPWTSEPRSGKNSLLSVSSRIAALRPVGFATSSSVFRLFSVGLLSRGPNQAETSTSMPASCAQPAWRSIVSRCQEAYGTSGLSAVVPLSQVPSSYQG